MYSLLRKIAQEGTYRRFFVKKGMYYLTISYKFHALQICKHVITLVIILHYLVTWEHGIMSTVLLYAVVKLNALKGC